MASLLGRLDLRGVTGDLRSRLPRPSAPADEPVEAVRKILAAVAQDGDQALRELTATYDGVQVDDLQVAPEELAAAAESIDADLRAALEVAHEAIRDFHQHQRRGDTSYQRDGVSVTALRRGVDRVGLYVPGGLATYPSTVLMTAVPARVAGVGEVALCVPPDDQGRVPAVTLAAASLAGVDEVYRVGGAQAIAALAYGTETVRPVDLIAGPGNTYVAVAQREVSDRVRVPAAFTGPSEVVVVADETAVTDHVAIDLIVQAEHGPGGLAWLVTWSERVADEVTAAVDRLVADAPRQSEIRSTLAEGGHAVLVDSPPAAIAVSDVIAPEHLELLCDGADELAATVRHAGAVFTGPWAPASLGDYVAGPSHVLPTAGTARFAGALTVDDFQKDMHVITADEAGFTKLAPHIETLARAEGLDAHAESVGVRLR